MSRRLSRRSSASSVPRLRATVAVEVPFQDADPTGVAWHGNYFRYFDVARCALLDRIGYGYRAMADSGLMWPIVDTRVRYLRSASFGATLQVTAELEEWEYRLRISYGIVDTAGRRVTEAYTVQVPVDALTGELCFGMPAPLKQQIDQRIHAALHD